MPVYLGVVVELYFSVTNLTLAKENPNEDKQTHAHNPTENVQVGERFTLLVVVIIVNYRVVQGILCVVFRRFGFCI